MGYIAQKHGDLVAMVAGDDGSTTYLPLKGSNQHLETLLQHIEKKATLQAADSNLVRQFDYIARSIRRRMMIVVVSDDMELNDDHKRLLRRLGAQHELMWITIGDSDVLQQQSTGADAYDVSDTVTVPAFLLKDKQVAAEFAKTSAERNQVMQQQLDRLRISNHRVIGEADAVTGLFKLLEKQRYARR